MLIKMITFMTKKGTEGGFFFPLAIPCIIFLVDLQKAA